MKRRDIKKPGRKGRVFHHVVGDLMRFTIVAAAVAALNELSAQSSSQINGQRNIINNQEHTMNYPYGFISRALLFVAVSISFSFLAHAFDFLQITSARIPYGSKYSCFSETENHCDEAVGAPRNEPASNSNGQLMIGRDSARFAAVMTTHKSGSYEFVDELINFNASFEQDPKRTLVVRDVTIIGVASTYNPYRPGRQEGGKETASGEPYDPFEWTAAIQTDLRDKFGGVRFGKQYRPVYALVESADKQAIIKINDVGPLRPGRIIDFNERTMRYFDPTLELGLIKGVIVTPLIGDDWFTGPIKAAFGYSGVE